MSAPVPSQDSVGKKVNQNNGSSFILSLVGGLIITVGSLLGVSLAMLGRPYFWGVGGMMWGGNYGMMGGYFGNGNISYPASYYGMMTGIELLGLVSGIVVLTFAILMRSRPSETKTYGAIVLIFSIVSLLGTGGFFVGALLGIVGGALALATSQ